ncbi:MAG: DUF4286 family protein [Pyrinomonadaceae bacterium]|nr:DUF4286 family protein [Pyrinomonadaceae bacterium]
MLIYEVAATVEAEIAVDYESYMTERHIPEILATGYFAAAFFAKNGGQYRIGYHADSQELFDAYIANDAERLREDFAKHFPAGIEVSRQVLDIVGLFPAP